MNTTRISWNQKVSSMEYRKKPAKNFNINLAHYNLHVMIVWQTNKSFFEIWFFTSQTYSVALKTKKKKKRVKTFYQNKNAHIQTPFSTQRVWYVFHHNHINLIYIMYLFFFLSHLLLLLFLYGMWPVKTVPTSILWALFTVSLLSNHFKALVSLAVCLNFPF